MIYSNAVSWPTFMFPISPERPGAQVIMKTISVVVITNP